MMPGRSTSTILCSPGPFTVIDITSFETVCPLRIWRGNLEVKNFILLTSPRRSYRFEHPDLDLLPEIGQVRLFGEVKFSVGVFELCYVVGTLTQRNLKQHYSLFRGVLFFCTLKILFLAPRDCEEPHWHKCVTYTYYPQSKSLIYLNRCPGHHLSGATWEDSRLSNHLQHWSLARALIAHNNDPVCTKLWTLHNSRRE